MPKKREESMFLRSCADVSLLQCSVSSVYFDVNCLEIRHIVYEIQSSTTQTCRLLEQPRKYRVIISNEL